MPTLLLLLLFLLFPFAFTRTEERINNEPKRGRNLAAPSLPPFPLSFLIPGQVGTLPPSLPSARQTEYHFPSSPPPVWSFIPFHFSRSEGREGRSLAAFLCPEGTNDREGEQKSVEERKGPWGGGGGRNSFSFPLEVPPQPPSGSSSSDAAYFFSFPDVWSSWRGKKRPEEVSERRRGKGGTHGSNRKGKTTGGGGGGSAALIRLLLDSLERFVPFPLSPGPPADRGRRGPPQCTRMKKEI